MIFHKTFWHGMDWKICKIMIKVPLLWKEHGEFAFQVGKKWREIIGLSSIRIWRGGGYNANRYFEENIDFEMSCWHCLMIQNLINVWMFETELEKTFQKLFENYSMIKNLAKKYMSKKISEIIWKFSATLPAESPTPLSESKRLAGASFPPDASTFRRCQSFLS